MSFKRVGEYDGMGAPGDRIATPHSAAIIVLGALLFLYMVRKGFRGFSVPGVGSVNVAG